MSRLAWMGWMTTLVVVGVMTVSLPFQLAPVLFGAPMDWQAFRDVFFIGLGGGLFASFLSLDMRNERDPLQEYAERLEREEHDADGPPSVDEDDWKRTATASDGGS